MIRTFIAIELSEHIKKELSDIEKELKETKAVAKWVKPDDIHLTLKFLGNVEEEKIELIKKSIQESVKGVTPFIIDLKDIGAFPSPSRPRVIWVGVQSGKERIKNLAESIEGNLEKIGFKKEDRQFSAHITLGRIKSLVNIDKLKDLIKEKKYHSSSFEVSKIAIMRSDLTPEGPIYTKLSEIKF